MRRPKRRSSSFLIAVAIGIGLITPRTAAAECVMLWKNIQDATRCSALVFSGTVVSWHEGYDALDITFAVERVWKGDLRRRSVLPMHMDLDSYRLAPGEPYLVFAGPVVASPAFTPTPGKPVFYVSQCSPTRRLTEASHELKELGRGHRPQR
jgi:hypothetical protein